MIKKAMTTYKFSELLDRCYQPLEEKDNKRAKMPFPTVGFSGSKKTIWTNFDATCKCLNRDPVHFQKFISTELCTDCSTNDEAELVLKGRFRVNKIESILKKYAQKQVQCQSCKKLLTEIEKEGKITFLKCLNCRCRVAIENIK